MNLILLLFIIPTSFAAVFEVPPNCGELGQILQGYESRLQRDSIKGCDDKLYQTLVNNVPGLSDKEFLKDKACLDLATIETQVEQAKVELAVLNGIHKLVESVKDAKAKAAASSPEVAKPNGQSFVESLNTAQSIEILLNTETADGIPFFEALKAFPKNNLLNLNDLKDRVGELCTGKPKDKIDACNKTYFNPEKLASEEILGLVSNTTPDKDTLQKWKDQLAIKRKNGGENDSYSFTQMNFELRDAFAKIDSKEVMNKEQLKAIAALDDFEFDDKFNFVQNIKGLKNQKSIKEATDKFLLLMGDAKQREKFQVQSKLSIIWDDVKNGVNLNDSERSSCSNAKNNYADVVACSEALEKALPNVSDPSARPKLKGFLPALKTSVNYVSKLESQEESCREEIKNKSEVTEACYAEFNRDRAKLQDQILQLNLVKDKIGAQNVDLMKLRNFALKKWTDLNCGTQSSPMDLCEDPSVISKDALLTAEDSMKIAVLFSQSDKNVSEAEEKVKAICLDKETQEKAADKRMCSFFWPKEPLVIKPKEEKNENVTARLKPDDDDSDRKIKDAWIRGGANILGTALSQLYPQNQNPYMSNPYPYNYTTYGTGTGPMGIADTIMFNARYYGGYGFYMPTPGYAPYQAFGTNSSMYSYKPVSAPATRYFSY